MSRCNEPGCKRRCLAPYERCVNHRPPNPNRNDGDRKKYDKDYAEKLRRRRAACGLAEGFE